MILLGIETTARVASAALWKDGRILASGMGDTAKKHAETILPLVESILDKAGMTLKQVNYIACDVGPGSFTGERIGVSTANALARALGIEVIPVDSLTVLAKSAGGHRPVCAMIDALHGNAYSAVFLEGACLRPPEAISLDELIPLLRDDTVFVGDIAAYCEKTSLPGAETLCEVAAGLSSRAKPQTTPLYLRSSQAERVRARREGASK